MYIKSCNTLALRMVCTWYSKYKCMRSIPVYRYLGGNSHSSSAQLLARNLPKSEMLICVLLFYVLVFSPVRLYAYNDTAGVEKCGEGFSTFKAFPHYLRNMRSRLEFPGTGVRVGFKALKKTLAIYTDV